MRIAALGDAHLGRSAFSATAPDGANQRETDFEESFTAAVDLCLAQNPELVLWLGDVFDHPRPSYRSFLVAMRALAKIRAHGVPLVAISGNHDTPRLPGNGNPYRVLSEAFPEFTFAHRMEYERVDVGGTALHLVPQTRTVEDARAALERADRERSLDHVNVLVTHPLVSSVERRYADINEIELDDADLQSDLVLLGHYHFNLQVKPGVWYAGSTDTFSFADDPDKAKGIVVLDTETADCRHVALTGQRPLVSLDAVNCYGRGSGEIAQEIQGQLERVPDGAVARLVLDGIAPEVYRLLDLHGIHHDARNLLNVKLEPRFDVGALTVEELPELDTMAVRWKAYVAEQPLEGVDADRVTATGAEYLEKAIDAAIDAGGD
jgi:DNA repair exonuclease SbcCD nuclease subunit